VQAWRVVHQATLTQDGRHYDALTIGWSNGAQQTMYCDILETGNSGGIRCDSPRSTACG
jgi:hypothetical protein